MIYAPCDVKPFPHSELSEQADLLVVGNTIVGEELKDGYVLSQDSFLRDDLFSMDEIVQLKTKYNIANVIATHLEEDWGKPYDDYKALESEYENIRFAYDGMIIEL